MRSRRNGLSWSEVLTSFNGGERRGLRTRAVRLARHAAGLLLPLAALAFAALMLVPALLGYHRYVVTGGSMSGTYGRGSIVYDRAVPVGELRVGDVITYEPPAKTGVHGSITHRLVSIRKVDGQLVFRTKGDANPKRDPWTFKFREPTQARVAFAVPWAGYFFAAFGIRAVRMALIGLPALLIAVLLLARLWREAGEESRRIGEAHDQSAGMQEAPAESG